MATKHQVRASKQREEKSTMTTLKAPEHAKNVSAEARLREPETGKSRIFAGEISPGEKYDIERMTT
jgi:hypothetical protein